MFLLEIPSILNVYSNNLYTGLLLFLILGKYVNFIHINYMLLSFSDTG